MLCDSHHRSFLHLGAGLSVGLSGMAAGFAIGIVGDAGVRGTAQQPRLFVGMILILIFAEVLGLYGLIVALILSVKSQTCGHKTLTDLPKLNYCMTSSCLSRRRIITQQEECCPRMFSLHILLVCCSDGNLLLCCLPLKMFCKCPCLQRVQWLATFWRENVFVRLCGVFKSSILLLMFRLVWCSHNHI